MKAINAIAFILVAIGGLNWGLVGLGAFFGSNWNIVAMIFASWPFLLELVYVLVGISTIILLCTHKKTCKCCDEKKMDAPASAQPMM